MKRYEKKYGFMPISAQNLEFLLVEQGFIPAYEPRLITSFYYDSCDFSLYQESIHGNGKRHKFRARFYNLNDKCTLEDKVRAYDTGSPLLTSLPCPRNSGACGTGKPLFSQFSISPASSAGGTGKAGCLQYFGYNTFNKFNLS